MVWICLIRLNYYVWMLQLYTKIFLSSKYLLSSKKRKTILDSLYPGQSKCRERWYGDECNVQLPQFISKASDRGQLFSISKMKRKREDKLRFLTSCEAQLLLERIFTRSYAPPQYLYDRYVQYSINKPGNKKSRYPLTKSELAKINKSKTGKSTQGLTTRSVPFTIPRTSHCSQ